MKISTKDDNLFYKLCIPAYNYVQQILLHTILDAATDLLSLGKN